MSDPSANARAGRSATRSRSRRHARDAYLDIIDDLDAIVWEAEASTWRFTFVNARATSLLHIPRERWIADAESWTNAIHPDDRARWAEFQRSCLSEGTHDFLCRVMTADGNALWMDTFVHGVRDSAGTLRKYRGLTVNLTARMQAEQAHERLIGELRQSRDALRHAVHLRDEVLGVVAHDLRNPVHTIAMSAGTLMEMQLPDVERERHLRIIQRSARNMDRLIGDLLDVSRMHAGTFAVNRDRIDFGAVIDETMDMFAQQASAKRVRLTCERRNTPHLVRGDRQRLLQVLSNLVGNAIKFTPPDGAVIVRLIPGAGEVEITVTDTGPGIPGDSVPRVFDRFWQLNRKGTIGAGLGLTIARTIVEAHGGRIWVNSAPGAGSTFGFTIPAMTTG